MTKTITTHTLQQISVSTSLPFSQVISRLDEQVARGTSASLTGLRDATTKQEFEEVVNNLVGPSGFMFFNEFKYDDWLHFYSDSTQVRVYVVGNPLIAQTMLRYDFHAAYNVPVRLLVLEKADRAGTEVVYHLPSSVIALGDDERLRAAAEVLDMKLESLVNNITAV